MILMMKISNSQSLTDIDASKLLKNRYEEKVGPTTVLHVTLHKFNRKDLSVYNQFSQVWDCFSR